MDVEFCGEIRQERDLAFEVFDGENKIWIPKSQIREQRRCSTPGDFIFVIPEWLAKEKGII